ncbi:hypothetical protein [Trichlorobacter lovleyi]|jgi:hypothetical protein|uniref:Uncharacterized protein n=1 Tax=Trichlorobacter lovleyi (strain ATCC BAA-1151 / DSM 17278 / SZ) TaxID=398767 RepID=B3E809_TRIL1|nr:hypothetical protein [Trichlorobacter lovleyi]ACD96582.1 hypothetical protein Glov_2871 [Trichlorobacter lovleyi SZ]ACD96584.1 hypothetical protein Glov_2873 [Trichlorobacter lovleyi SZ]
MQLFISLFKWVFTSNEFVWFVMGGLFFTTNAYLYLKLRERNLFSRVSFTFVALSVAFFTFALLWTVSSYQENEIIAANLGLVIFGGIAAVMGIIAYRMIIKITKVAQID